MLNLKIDKFRPCKWQMQTTQVFCLHFVAMTVSKIMSISNLDKKPSTLNQVFPFQCCKVSMTYFLT